MHRFAFEVKRESLVVLNDCLPHGQIVSDNVLSRFCAKIRFSEGYIAQGHQNSAQPALSAIARRQGTL